MSKIIKKSDITNLVESTMKEAGILKEEEIEATEVVVDENEDIEADVEIDEACDDLEESEEVVESDVVAESVNKLASDASEHNIISENLKKDLESFNKIINYKY
jgi:hypothetical protein